MATDIILVVGKSPLDDKFGFNAVSDMAFGSFIPDKIEDSYITKFEADKSTGDIILEFANGLNILGATATITLDSDITIELSGVDGVYTTGATPSIVGAADIASAIDGVKNMTVTGS